VFGEELLRDAELGGVLADVAQRRARGFLHHASKLAGERHVTSTSGHERRLDEQDVAANLGPRNARRDTGS
jgi:hypothetical protein